MPKKRNWLKKALPRQPTDDSQQDIELSDQDIQALQEYGDSLGFLAHFDASAQYVNKKQPRAEMAPKNDASGDDDIYEEAPRPRQLDTAPTRLPIKTADGRVVQLEAKRARVKQDKPMVVESESDEAEQQVAPLSKDKLVTASIRNEKRKIAAEMNADTCKNMAVIEVKQNLAESALALIEDPEMNIGKLKDLRLFAKDKRPQVIRLLFLTQLAVFKDIIPGYRIRPMTDAERAMQSSKGVRSLRNYEETLLTNYQQYLQSLEDACKSNLKQHGNRQVLETAVYCMAELLGSVSHFNFRANLITALASKIVLRKFPQVTLICSDAFSKLFKYDEQGEATLEAVKVLSEVFQAVKYDMLPIALHPFMCLHLQEASAVYRKKNYGGGNPKKRRKEAPHMSKKIRKINEYRKEVDLEMMEAEATYDKNQRSDALKYLFLIYFNILKKSADSTLLPKVLEGLSMFAQLINVDYFEDLLNVLQNIAKTQYDAYVTGKLNSNSAPVCALHCVIAAFELLESLKNTLSVDLRDFYCSFYTQMMRMTARTSSAENVVVAKSNHSRNENELMLRGIDMMMKKKIDIPNERVAAFVKRLGILSLSSPANAAAAYISAIHWAFVRYPRFQCFVEEDGRIGTGCFEAFVDDPDLCNPFASSLWDLQLLSKHYHPAVRVLAGRVLNTKASANNQIVLGTDLDIESIRKAKPVGILKEFAPFQKDGFELNPQVSVPSSILSALKRMQASSRTVLSGPSAVAPSEFMMLVMESDFKISEFK